MAVLMTDRPIGFVAPRENLPMPALLVLALTGFSAILTETLPAGLLGQMADSLQVSQSLAGQLITAYALGSLLTAIPLIVWTQGWRRKPVRLLAIAGFIVFNTITAASTSYSLTLFARFLAGVAGGLGWGIVTGYARRLVVERLQGKALAIVMAGTPIALSLGVPAGTFFGSMLGWRSAYIAMTVIALLIAIWVVWKMPDFPGQPAGRKLSFSGILVTPGIRPILIVLFCWMTAHTVLYTYITSFAALAHLESSVDLLLLSFGLAALVGLWVTGAFVDRLLRKLVIGCLLTFCAIAVSLTFSAQISNLLIATLIVWGLSFGGAGTQLATALGDAAGDGVDLANAMLTTVWNCAIAAGGLFGGILLDRGGAGALGWAAFALTFAGLLISIATRRHAFRPGPRARSKG